MKQQDIHIETGHGTDQLFGVLSIPDEKHAGDIEHTLVIMVHDIPFSHSLDHGDLFGYLRNVFDDHGYKTLVFDFESCGGSDGLEEDFTFTRAYENLKNVIAFAQSHKFERFIFVATGAAAALCLDIAEQKSTKAMFLFWPVVDLAAHAKRIFYDGTPKRHKTGQELIQQMENFNPQSLFKKLWVPILIQSGGQDQDQANIEIIKEGIKAMRIDVTSYDDGRPGLPDPRHRKMVAHHIGTFLKKYA